MSRSFFGSVLTYELGKQLGIEAAAAELAEQLRAPSVQSLPAVRVMARLARLGELAVYHGAGTFLPKARSRAAHAALESGSDYWVMCDDDVETDSATLEALIAAAGPPNELGAAVLPCLLRGNETERHTVNVQWDSELVEQRPLGPVRRVARAGCGLMVVTRTALRHVVDSSRPSLRFVDDDGIEKVAIFQTVMVEDVRANGAIRWLGEDLSFCTRLRAADVEIFAPCAGISVHDGYRLDLGSI